MTTNWALTSNGATSAGSNTYSTGPGTEGDIAWVNDGLTSGSRYDGDPTHYYLADPADNLVITFASSQTINQITAFFSDIDTRSTDPSTSTVNTNGYQAQSFTLQTWNGSSWDTRGTFTSNDKLKCVANFAPIATTKIKIDVTVASLGWALQELEAVYNVGVGSSSGSATVSGVGNSTAPTAAGTAAGTSTVTGYSNRGVGAAAGTATAAADGVLARASAGVSTGTGHALGHPPYFKNYRYAPTADLIQEVAFAGTFTLTPSDTYFNNIKWGASTNRLFYEGETVRFTWATPHWIVGVRAWSGAELLSASSEPSDAATASSAYLGTPGNANPWSLYSPDAVETYYSGTPALMKQEIVFPDGPVYTNEIQIRHLTHDPSSPFVVDITELEVIGVGFFYLLNLASALNFASTVRCGITASLSSSANFASAASGNDTAGISSALNIASVVTGQRTGTRSLASGVDFASAADGDKTGALASSLNLASAATGVRETDCASAIQLTAVATGITTRNERLVSAVDFVSAVEPLDAVALASAINIASAAVGIKTVALSLASNLGLASASVGSKVDALALTSALNVASVVSFNAVLHESLASVVNFTSFVRLPSGALMQLFTNPHTMAAATWSGLPFNSMIEVDGVVYGAGVNGLYVLDDKEDDIGEDVDAEVTWDLMNFGDHNKKRYEGGYVSGTAAGPLNFRFVNDQGTFNYPTDRSSAAHPVNHRATFGRGLFSSYARLSLTNLNGKTFDVSDVRVQLYKTTRRS